MSKSYYLQSFSKLDHEIDSENTARFLKSLFVPRCLDFLGNHWNAQARAAVAFGGDHHCHSTHAVNPEARRFTTDDIYHLYHLVSICINFLGDHFWGDWWRSSNCKDILDFCNSNMLILLISQVRTYNLGIALEKRLMRGFYHIGLASNILGWRFVWDQKRLCLCLCVFVQI